MDRQRNFGTPLDHGFQNAVEVGGHFLNKAVFASSKVIPERFADFRVANRVSQIVRNGASRCLRKTKLASTP